MYRGKEVKVITNALVHTSLPFSGARARQLRVVGGDRPRMSGCPDVRFPDMVGQHLQCENRRLIL